MRGIIIFEFQGLCMINFFFNCISMIPARRIYIINHDSLPGSLYYLHSICYVFSITCIMHVYYLLSLLTRLLGRSNGDDLDLQVTEKRDTSSLDVYAQEGEGA